MAQPGSLKPSTFVWPWSKTNLAYLKSFYLLQQQTFNLIHPVWTVANLIRPMSPNSDWSVHSGSESFTLCYFKTIAVHTENRDRNKIHLANLFQCFTRNLNATLFRMVKLHWSLRYPFLYNCYTRPVRTSLIAASVIGGGYYIYNERQANTQANFTKWGFHFDGTTDRFVIK